MVDIKLVLSDPLSGKAKQIEIKEKDAARFIGLKIGDIVEPAVLRDYMELPPSVRIRITGGSGVEGAPMHPGIRGAGKAYALLSSPPGHRPRRRGERRRKLVRGNTVSDRIVQINAVLVYPANWDGTPIIPLGDKEAQKFVQKEAEAES